MNFKALFATPKKAAITVACLLVMAATAAVCVLYGMNMNAQPANESTAIGSENARNFACADAGVDPTSAQAVEVKYERFEGQFVYRVTFIAEGTEYEYRINAEDGSVVKKESKTAAGPESTALLPSTVTLEHAQEIALADAGVSRDEAVFTGISEDAAGNAPIYVLKFYAGNMEYAYEINARTGAVYSKKVTSYMGQNPGGTPSAQPSAPVQTPQPTAQPDPTEEPTQPPASNSPEPAETGSPTQPPATDPPQPTSRPVGKYIGMRAAKNAALADAGVPAGEARFTGMRMDYENGTAVYVLEFCTSAREYTYQINAQTGAVYSRHNGARSGQ